ncbi:MAG: hypothetical protein HC836_46205 [Richelia sp. RM2_1_2]|nr:hypothetical protein [Richelia sp. RM2_1_2]
MKMKLKDNTLEFLLSRQGVILLANATFFRLLKILASVLNAHIATVILTGFGVSAVVLVIWYFWHLKQAENSRKVAIGEVRNNSQLIFRSEEFEAEVEKLVRLPKFLSYGVPTSAVVGAILGLV